MPYDNDDWPSEDGATAVEEHDGAGVAEDESGHSETSDTANDPASATSSSHPPAQLPMSLTKIFDSGVSVSVNGEPWLQVVMGDRGPDEAFVVVYGLLPDRDYEILLCVGKDEAVVSAQTSSVAALNTKSLSDKGRSLRPGQIAFIRMLTSDKVNVTSSSPSTIDNAAGDLISSNDHSRTSSANVHPPSAGNLVLRSHTPPTQDSADPNSVLNDSVDSDGIGPSPGQPTPTHVPASTAASATVMGSGVGAGALTASALQATVNTLLRKARKDTSRAESALRNEIEALKRALDRMSGVDHRAKQKVLALQESIRQATQASKDIDEETTLVEQEKGKWEDEEKEKDEELKSTKAQVGSRVKESEGKIEAMESEVKSFEAEVDVVKKRLEAKLAEKKKLESEKVVELENEIKRLQDETDRALRSPAYEQQHLQQLQQPQGGSGMGGHPPYVHYYQPHSPHQQGQLGNNTAFVPSQIVGGRSGRGGAGRGGRTASGGTSGGGGGGKSSSRRHYGRGGHLGRQTPHHQSGSDELEGYTNQSPQAAHHYPLNPANPEFVPSASASPITAKGTLAAPSSLGPHHQYHSQTSNSVGVSPHLAPRSVHSGFGNDVATIQQQRRSSFSPNLSGVSSGTSPIGPPSQGVPPGSSPSLWTSQNPNSATNSSGLDIWGMPIAPASPKVATSAFNPSPSLQHQGTTSSPPSHFGNNPFSSGMVDSPTASSSPMHAAFLRGTASGSTPGSIGPPWHPVHHNHQQQQQQQLDPLSIGSGRGSAPVSPTFATHEEARASPVAAPGGAATQGQVDWSSMPMSFASVAADRAGRRN